MAVAALLGELRGMATGEMLGRHYRERGGDWALAVIARWGLGE